MNFHNLGKYPMLVAAREVLKLSFLDMKRSMSLTIFLAGHLIPELLRMCIYVLIALLVTGADSLNVTATGIIALITIRMTVSEQSGIPVGDVWSRTIGTNAVAILPLCIQYVIRSVPIQIIALIDSLILFVIINIVYPMYAPSIGAWLLSLCCIPSGIAFGTAISASCLGKNMHNMVHNIAATLITVYSGAVVSSNTIPLFKAVGSILPITHSVEILHIGVLSKYTCWLGIQELFVGLVWFVLGFIAYSFLVRNARRTGSTYLGI